MNKDELLELREIFRKKFSEHNFCIGESLVEQTFRELLGEPEPEIPHYGPGLSANETVAILKEIISSDRMKTLFESDNVFLNNLRKE